MGMLLGLCNLLILSLFSRAFCEKYGMTDHRQGQLAYQVHAATNLAILQQELAEVQNKRLKK
jgi:hypothetical protein